MRDMRRKDRQTTQEIALGITDKCACAVLATVNSDGSPYCVPLSMVRDGQWLYFHSAQDGHKIENLKNNNRVCISFVGEVKPKPGAFSVIYESAIINGTASEVTEQEEKIRVLRIISERYTPANMPAFDKAIEKELHVTGIWKIHIDEISGKKNS